MRRRVGAALLAGVTALGVAGVAALAGEGVANAAAPTVSASVSAAPTISGSASGVALNNTITLTISGAVAVGDHITLTIPCPSTGEIDWHAVPTATDGNANSWSAAGSLSSSSCTFNGTAYNNVLTLVAPSGVNTSATTTTITISGVTLDTLGAPSGSVAVTGAYQPVGVAASSFSASAIATVSWFSTTSNIPAVSTSGTGAASVSNITISQPAGLTNAITSGATTVVSVTLHNASFSGTSVSASAIPSNAFTSTSLTGTISGATATLTATASASATWNPATAGVSLTFSGISIVPSGTGGPITGTVSFTSGTNSGTVALSVPIATEIGASTRLYGYTADDTVATEFEAAFPVTSGGVRTAVVATDKDPYDALTAAYLAGQLGTGVLIVPQTGFTGSAAAQAIQLEGVTSVYIVGGPLAVPSTVTSQITSTPAYNVGGVTQTGSNLTIAAQIYGTTADDTAQMVATHFGTAFGEPPATPSAYNGAGGTYNDTSGTSSATGPTTPVPTAFVISDTDWQDATTLGPIAYAYRIPIILTQANYSSSAIGSQATSALTTLGIKQAIVVGGQLAFPNAWVSSIQSLNGGISVMRIAGQDYTDTAVQLAKFELATSPSGLGWHGGTATGYLLSHGDYWADALGAAAIAGNPTFAVGGTTFGYEPIVTTENPTTEGQYLSAYVTSVAPSGAAINVLGGPLAVSSTLVTSIQASLAS